MDSVYGEFVQVKILAFSDLHCKTSFASQAVEMAGDVDLIVGAGDFANQHRGLEKTLDILSAIETPTVLVPGNNETLEALQEATRGWPAAVVLHGEATEVGGMQIVGIGGGIPVTPFGAWSFDLSEERAEQLLAPFESADLVVSHSPPSGVADVDSSGISRGSTALRDFVERAKPQLFVCGHIHDSWQVSGSIGGCHVRNLGPEPHVLEIRG